MTDALGNATTYTYDEMDRVLTMTDARGGVTAYTYTDRGDVATETDANGNVISYEYDENRNLVKMTTVDGVTTYEYDALDRLVSTTTPDGKTVTTTYSGEGEVLSSTDKGGHTTQYVLDANGNVVEAIDALGNSTLYEYDLMGNLVKTSLHRVDTQDNVDEWEITTYEYDGNGNLTKQTDADGTVTEYTYSPLDLVTNINYNGGKSVSYQYNGTGELVQMTDWTGTTSFELDLLNQITKVTDTKGAVVEYEYDATGNQTAVHYPDDTTVTKTYDLNGNLKTVTEDDGRTTTYSYDGMNRLSRMEYPHGWVEDYHYDAIGQLTSVEDTDPTQKDMKQQKHVYRYDDCGNLVYEYMRGNGTGEATVENTYTYDALHRIVAAHEDYGNDNRTYTYDSLGNLTYETAQGNKSVDYKLNNLNQITSSSDDGWKTYTTYSYDARGNLIQEVYTKNKKNTITGAYVYDETNKMVSGTNAGGEVSNYIYNGLGALAEQQWIITKNGYGYHSVDAGDAEVTYPAPGLKKSSTVIKQFTVDYTSETFEPLMEHEINGLDYRYVYGNDRLSVDISPITTSSGNIIENGDHIRLYYHMDYLGTADYLTSPVSLKVTSWTHYNEWGEITHNVVLKCGQRQLDLVKRYATHDYDTVLDQYYAKARFYDAGDRRFTAMDPVKGNISDPMSMVQYLYCLDNGLTYIDPLGLAVKSTDKTDKTMVTPKSVTVPANKTGKEVVAPQTESPKTTKPTTSITPSQPQNNYNVTPPDPISDQMTQALKQGDVYAATALWSQENSNEGIRILIDDAVILGSGLVAGLKTKNPYVGAGVVGGSLAFGLYSVESDNAKGEDLTPLAAFDRAALSSAIGAGVTVVQGTPLEEIVNSLLIVGSAYSAGNSAVGFVQALKDPSATTKEKLYRGTDTLLAAAGTAAMAYSQWKAWK